ncbi:inhibin beta chain-like [Daktulosphaira vitifoliae]|uniref:inhibin beta chain-like n=1 Tax=Daktulosphaira vitifoliae TaxID=58002 RepID=UPI0021A97C15|nr:inhibin beta chain-like [Daktulosphaira vitifoliae]
MWKTRNRYNWSWSIRIVVIVVATAVTVAMSEPRESAASSSTAAVTSQLERAPFMSVAVGQDGVEHQTNMPDSAGSKQHCPWCKQASDALPSTANANRHHHRRKHKLRGRRHYDSVARSSLDKQRIEAIKEQILSKLGMTAKPNVTKARSTRFLAEALAVEPLSGLTATDSDTATGNTLPPSTRFPLSPRDSDSEPDDFYGRTREIIGFAEPGSTLNGQTLLEFPWSQDMGSSDSVKVKSAKLWFRLEYRPDVPPVARRSHHSHNVTLWLFKINFRANPLRNTTFLSGKEFDEHATLASSLSLSLNNLGWISVDVTNTVQEWYGTSGKHRLRFHIDCSGCGGLVSPVLFHDTRQANEWENPFLMVYTDPTVTRRVRRRALDCSLAVRGQCCKQRFYIKFQDIGWDSWIIAPGGYYANYCRGDCGGVHRTPDTYLNFYTQAIEDYRKAKHSSIFQPCCAPVKFSSMSLIYFTDDGNIIKRDLPKMVIDECGCP